LKQVLIILVAKFNPFYRFCVRTSSLSPQGQLSIVTDTPVTINRLETLNEGALVTFEGTFDYKIFVYKRREF
jgi:hypothetical protein